MTTTRKLVGSRRRKNGKKIRTRNTRRIRNTKSIRVAVAENIKSRRSQKVVVGVTTPVAVIVTVTARIMSVGALRAVTGAEA
jgi:hypothetical protein